MFIFIMYE